MNQAPFYEYSRMSLGIIALISIYLSVCLLIYFLSVVSGILCLWFLVTAAATGMGSFSWSEHQLQSNISAPPPSSAPSLPQRISKTGQIVSQMFCGCVAVQFSLLVSCILPSHIQEIRIQEWKLDADRGLNSLCSVSCLNVVLFSLWRVTLS